MNFTHRTYTFSRSNQNNAWFTVMHYHVQLYTHRRRLSGQPGHVPPIIEKRRCIYHFLPPFAPNIFDKSTPVCRPTRDTACRLKSYYFRQLYFLTLHQQFPGIFHFAASRLTISRATVAFAPVARLIASPKTTVFKLGPTSWVERPCLHTVAAWADEPLG